MKCYFNCVVNLSMPGFISGRLKFALILLVSVMLSGCSIVTDKGRYVDISKSDNYVCPEKRDVVFYVNNIKRSTWSGANNVASYEFDIYTKKIEKKLNESGCFNKVELTRMQLSMPPEDAVYLEFSYHISESSFIPFLENILSIYIPIGYDKEVTLEVVSFNDIGKKQYYKIYDHFKVHAWTPFVLLTPFFEHPDLYPSKKVDDMLDAMLMKIKIEGFLKGKKI